jgi:hypothetical protein
MNLTGLEVAIYVFSALIMLAVAAFPIIAIARAKPSDEE